MVLDPLQVIKNVPLHIPYTICWRCDKLTGILQHTLWACKNLLHFWNAISSFHRYPVKTNTRNGLTWVKSRYLPIMLQNNSSTYPNSRRLTITSIWKSTESPNPSNIITRLNMQSQYELLLAHKNSSFNKCKKIGRHGYTIQELLII